jgi:hypothetical protein
VKLTGHHLTIVVHVECDAAHTDPHDVAQDIVDSYENDRRHGYSGPAVEFVSAEWTDAP